MNVQVENPVGGLADQGSQDFGVLTSNTTTPQTEKSTQANEGVTTQKTETGGTTPVGQQPGTPAAPDMSAIIKSTVDATAAALQRQTQTAAELQDRPAQKELSPQEFDQRYGIVRPNEEMITRIIGQDPKVAVQTLDTLFQANLTAALRMANDLVEAKLREYNGTIEPHIKSWQTAQKENANKAAESRFFSSYPDLTNERELVMEIKDAYLTKVREGQVHFTTEAQAFQAVATAVKSILKKTASAGTHGVVQSGGQTQGQSQGRQMSAASSAGRTGTGQAAASQTVVDEVFGVDAR